MLKSTNNGNAEPCAVRTRGHAPGRGDHSLPRWSLRVSNASDNKASWELKVTMKTTKRFTLAAINDARFPPGDGVTMAEFCMRQPS